jgi:uncharacterized protein YceH (UPF0502 family)
MLTLTPNESRVLGVLVEKAQTTPGQYPMTLNAMTAGANQKNNRDPVLNLTEEQVHQAVESLRTKRLANEVMLSGSRVQKYRHIARETLDVQTSELVILTELLLRGPQTIGELRGRAARMSPMESTEIVKNILDSLAAKPTGAMVKEIAPAPGDRAPRYMQLICPGLHPINAGPAAAPVAASRGASSTPPPSESSSDVLDRITRLEDEIAELRQTVTKLAESLGAPDLVKSGH